MSEQVTWYDKVQSANTLGSPSIRVESNDIYLDVKLGKGYLGNRFTAEGAAEAMTAVERIISDLQDVRNVLDGIRQELK